MNIFNVIVLYTLIFSATTIIAIVCEALDGGMVWINVFHTPTLHRNKGFQIILCVLSIITAFLHGLCGNILGFVGFFIFGLYQKERVRNM